MAPELSERVFEPGSAHARPITTGQVSGLALARRLARAADGDLVADLSGTRTTFRLTLPTG